MGLPHCWAGPAKWFCHSALLVKGECWHLAQSDAWIFIQHHTSEPEHQERAGSKAGNDPLPPAAPGMNLPSQHSSPAAPHPSAAHETCQTSSLACLGCKFLYTICFLPWRQSRHFEVKQNANGAWWKRVCAHTQTPPRKRRWFGSLSFSEHMFLGWGVSQC